MITGMSGKVRLLESCKSIIQSWHADTIGQITLFGSASSLQGQSRLWTEEVCCLLVCDGMRKKVMAYDIVHNVKM
jgi:hypothetical protein